MPPTNLVNLEKSSARGEPFARETSGSESRKGGGRRQRNRLGRRGSFPTRHLKRGFLTEWLRGVELQDRVGFGKRRILGLTDLDAPHPAQDTLGGKVDGGGIQQNDALGPGVARGYQADPIGHGLGWIIAAGTRFEN